MDGVSNLCAAVEKSLKLGVNLHCTFKVEFRIDIFKHLFSDKGRRPPRGLGHFYQLLDYSRPNL